VNYVGFVAWLIEAVKELNGRIAGLFKASEVHSRDIASIKTTVDAKVQQLEAKNKQLEQDNQEMKARLDKIEKMLKSK
jgi:hypothetical protein